MAYDVQAWLQTRVAEDGAVPAHSFSDAFFPQKSDTKACEMPGALFGGFMTKQGGVVKNWKKRFFVLTPGLLTYYKDKNDCDPQGAVFLQNSELFSEPGKSNPIDLKVRPSPPSPSLAFTLLIPPPPSFRCLQGCTTFSAKQSPIVRSTPAPPPARFTLTLFCSCRIGTTTSCPTR